MLALRGKCGSQLSSIAPDLNLKKKNFHNFNYVGQGGPLFCFSPYITLISSIFHNLVIYFIKISQSLVFWVLFCVKIPRFGTGFT